MINVRRVAFGASVVLVAVGGYVWNASADSGSGSERSQDPRSWEDSRGKVDESKVPDRIAMSTPDLESGVVYIDPHQFYGELGADVDEGPVPVFAKAKGGDEVGTYDLRTGEITIEGSHDGRLTRDGRDLRRAGNERTTPTTLATQAPLAPVDTATVDTATVATVDTATIDTATIDTATADTTDTTLATADSIVTGASQP